MIDKIRSTIQTVNLSQENGRFLSDKSYAYDDVFFMAKFILANIDSTNVFNKTEHKEEIKEYIADIFQLTEKGTGAINYMSEALNILTFGGVITKVSNDEYKVVHPDILEFIAQNVENAYIYLYLVVHQTFTNDGLWPIYEALVKEPTQLGKERIVHLLYEQFRQKSPYVGTRRGSDEETNWSRQLTKYPLIVLGFANEEPSVTRTLNILDRATSVTDISINVQGTRSNPNAHKKNDYIDSFDDNYVKRALRPYLAKHVSVDESKAYADTNIATDLADLKIEIINDKKPDKPVTYTHLLDQAQYSDSKVKTRNQKIQRTFKQNLLDNHQHKCAVCDFAYKDLLIGSHIKPYAKCEDTYDAVNYFNGLLMCPNHDKLFDSIKLMTINSTTGEITLAAKIKASKEFGSLHGQFIDTSLVRSERKHYLKWHNEEFAKLNGA